MKCVCASILGGLVYISWRKTDKTNIEVIYSTLKDSKKALQYDYTSFFTHYK